MGREGNLTGAAVSNFKEQHTPFNIIYIMRSCGSDFETVSSFRFEV